MSFWESCPNANKHDAMRSTLGDPPTPGRYLCVLSLLLLRLFSWSRSVVAIVRRITHKHTQTHTENIYYHLAIEKVCEATETGTWPARSAITRSKPSRSIESPRTKRRWWQRQHAYCHGTYRGRTHEHKHGHPPACSHTPANPTTTTTKHAHHTHNPDPHLSCTLATGKRMYFHRHLQAGSCTC